MRVVFDADHDAAAFLGIRRLTFGLDLAIQFRRQHQWFHGQFSASPIGSAQKLSERYLLAESQKIVTTTPSFSFDATASAATMFAPEETPTRYPSSRANRTAIRCASSVATSTSSSA